MADYPANLYLRPPLFDGDDVLGGGLNAAVDRLSDDRAEIVAIETELGLSLKGSASSLAARLALRLSRNGIPRGQLFFASGGLWNNGTTWMQCGQSVFSAGTANFRFITFPKAYITADETKNVYLQIKSAHGTEKCGLGTVGRILATGFYVSAGYRNNVSYQSSLAVDVTVNWLAIGGTPA